MERSPNEMKYQGGPRTIDPGCRPSRDEPASRRPRAALTSHQRGASGVVNHGWLQPGAARARGAGVGCPRPPSGSPQAGGGVGAGLFPALLRGGGLAG